jgi:SAM-dependent methyltransferase
MFYGSDLAHIHAAGFEALAEGAARCLLSIPRIGPGVRVLDIGCGSGALAKALVTEGCLVWCLDVSRDMLQLARAQVPEATFVEGDVTAASFPEADAIVAVGEVLNYAAASDGDALRKFIEKSAAALQPGGVLLFDLAAPGRGRRVSAYTENSLWAVGMIAEERGRQLTRRISTFFQTDRGWQRAQETHRLALFPREEVIDLLLGAGFDVSTSDCYHDVVLPEGLVAYFGSKPENQ